MMSRPAKENSPSQPGKGDACVKGKPRWGKRVGMGLGAMAGVVLLVWLGWYANNNYSMMSDAEFARRVDAALERGTGWVQAHQAEILTQRNFALIRMLQDAGELHPEPVFDGIVKQALSAPLVVECWKGLLDAGYPIDSTEINYALQKEVIDNKWILYALAPKTAQLSAQERADFFNGDKWQQRQLTHQLWALLHLRRHTGLQEKTDGLIEHISNRLVRELTWNIAVTDIYIQRIAFVLKAGFAENIKRRWVERVIAHQREDGGWNDRWWCFTSRRRPTLSLSTPPSDQHATCQAVWLLYQVKYRYPEHFGLKGKM